MRGDEVQADEACHHIVEVGLVVLMQEKEVTVASQRSAVEDLMTSKFNEADAW